MTVENVTIEAHRASTNVAVTFLLIRVPAGQGKLENNRNLIGQEKSGENTEQSEYLVWYTSC